MLIFGTFEHSLELEQALCDIESNGIPKKHILLTLMDTTPENPGEFAGKSRDRYNKGIEVGMASATAISVIGVSIGFVLKWGPIIYGVLSAVVGFVLGFGLYLLTHKDNRRQLPMKMPEVVVVVQCLESQARNIVKILWNYKALTVGRNSQSAGES